MALSPLQVKVADIVCAHYMNSHRSASRRELVLLVRDGYVLDEMVNRSLLRTDANRKEYSPSLGSFALLEDTDNRLIAAHEATIRILRTLVSLYETRDPAITYTPDELIEEVRLLDGRVDPNQVRLGLYLSHSGFGAIQTHKPSDDGLDILSFTIAESVLRIDDPEKDWSRQVAISRNSASDGPRHLSLGGHPESFPNANEPVSLEPTASEITESQNDPAVAISGGDYPRVFISYSWDSDAHRKWVLSLATRLRSEGGVDVVLDEWHLGYGENRFLFMEQSVVSSAFILLVCTPPYAEKANDRQGGVGYESNIITSQIADRTDKQKFIPVLRSGEWKSALPVWLKHMTGCDLSADPYSEQQFQKLLRTLHGQQVLAPALGPRPSFPKTVAETIIQEPALPANPAPGFTSSLKSELSAKERELLDAAVNDPNGQISHRRPIGPESLMANGKSFIERGDARSKAAWLGALHALEQRGLMQPASPERHFYHVTDRGYEVADKLGHFVRWKTHEVLLEAYYMNAPKQSIVIKCTGIVEVPQIFYPSEDGDDGSGMRSIKRHRSLLIENVEPDTLADLSWQPSDVSFLDSGTNEQQSFRVSMAEPPERGTLLLEIAS